MYICNISQVNDIWPVIQSTSGGAPRYSKYNDKTHHWKTPVSASEMFAKRATDKGNIPNKLETIPASCKETTHSSKYSLENTHWTLPAWDNRRQERSQTSKYHQKKWENYKQSKGVFPWTIWRKRLNLEEVHPLTCSFKPRTYVSR